MGVTVLSASIVILSAGTMDHYDNNLDLCLRKPTNFSIDHILSTKHSRRKDGNRPASIALNKVPQNPWSSRGPLSFDPSLCKNQKSKVLSIQKNSNQCYSPGTAFPTFLPTSTATSTSLATNCQPNFYPNSEPISYDVLPKISEVNNNNQVNCFFNPPNYGHGDSGGKHYPKQVDQQSIGGYDDLQLIHKCSVCEKIFSSSETLETHINTHKTQRYECKECGRGFSQLRNYKYHLSVHRGTKEFAAKCPECNKTFNDKGYLSSHLKIHRNKKEYQCPHCPKCFNQRVAFNMHVRIHTGIKPHKCPECNKRFSRKMLLKQHLRTHSGEKPYQCSVCGKTFADRSNMTLHHRLHSGIKPFSCQMCPKSFTKKHHLKTHLNYHTGYKPYICPHVNCGQAFTQSSNMRTHAKKCPHKIS